MSGFPTDCQRRLSQEVAKAFAESEFETYRIVQDRRFESDFDRHIKQALEGGKIAGASPKDLESKSGRKVSTRRNFKGLPESRRRLREKGEDEE